MTKLSELVEELRDVDGSPSVGALRKEAATRIEKLAHALILAELGWESGHSFDKADKAMIEEALR